MLKHIFSSYGKALPWQPNRRRFSRLLPAALAIGALLGLPLSPRAGPLGSPSVARADTGDDDPVPPKVQAAVDKALAWLAKNQKPTGTWQAGNGISTSVPSLAVMAFLARGHVPGQGPYGDTINKAIDFVLSQQKDDGLLAGNNGNAQMYEHGISTAMLSEAFGMVDDNRKAKIEKALAKSAKLILDAQRPHDGKPKNMPYTGGWRYTKMSDDADISVTGWQLMGLRGAANCGATVPKESLDAGREFVRRCAVPKDSGGGFTYQAGNRDANSPRTGTGILSLELLGEHNSTEATLGGDYLLEHPLTDPNQGFYFYGVYYISQAYNQLGGKYWETGYPKLRDALLAAQNDQGIWPNGSGQEQEAGDAYRTSMACLALCVPYRYLPLYQK
jgi:hypothetical protein